MAQGGGGRERERERERKEKERKRERGKERQREREREKKRERKNARDVPERFSVMSLGAKSRHQQAQQRPPTHRDGDIHIYIGTHALTPS